MGIGDWNRTKLEEESERLSLVGEIGHRLGEWGSRFPATTKLVNGDIKLGENRNRLLFAKQEPLALRELLVVGLALDFVEFGHQQDNRRCTVVAAFERLHKLSPRVIETTGLSWQRDSLVELLDTAVAVMLGRAAIAFKNAAGMHTFPICGEITERGPPAVA